MVRGKNAILFFTIDTLQIITKTYICNKVLAFAVRRNEGEDTRERVVYLTRLFGDLRTIRRDINPGEKCTTIRGQDAALLHGKEGPVQQVHKQRCQRIRELGSRKEHAIANHHAAARLAHRGARCTPCCTRYVARFAIFLPRSIAIDIIIFLHEIIFMCQFRFMLDKKIPILNMMKNMMVL